MTTAIPPLTEDEKIEFGDISTGGKDRTDDSSFVVASYNIRYAVGHNLISGGLLRKAGLSNSARRSDQVAEHIKTAARAFSDGKLLPRPHVIALQEADKRTQRAGKHHVAHDLAKELRMAWVHASAGIPRGVKPKDRQWWLDFEEPI
jgi:hypothetical protein